MKNYARFMEEGWSYARPAYWRVAGLLAAFFGGMVADASAAEVALTWADNSTNESGFRIERATGTEGFSEIGTVAANVTSYVDDDVATGTTYQYRVRAYNSAGNSSYSNTATATVPAGPVPANTAPTISAISNQSVAAGSNTGALAFTIGDAESAASALVVTASSSNTSVVPNGGIALAGNGASRTITVTPANVQSGNSTITVVVDDGDLTDEETFVVTVTNPGGTNTAPTISNIFSRTITEDSSTGAISFTISDAESAASALTVTASSSNTTVVPNGNIQLGGTGGTRTISVTPAANQNGFSTITVTVSDGELTDTDTFRVTVSSVNDTPTISNISNQTIIQGSSTAALSFTVGDVETSSSNLSVTASSSNTSLVPNAGLVLGGSGSSRTLTVTPAANQSGSATITVTVSDGSASAADSFILTVNSNGQGTGNAAPTVSSVENQVIGVGGQVGPIPFSIADAESSSSALTVTATSSNQALVPNNNITIGGFGSNRTVTVSAAPGQSGSATITLRVSDGVNFSTETFIVSFGAAQAPASQMLNLSSRVMYRAGVDNLIPGFVVAGSGNKRVLLRVVGPTIGQEPYNVGGVLPNPRMTLKRWNGSAFVDHASNDNWSTNANAASIRQVSEELSAFPLVEGSLDAVLLVDLAPGQYTITASDASGASGIVIVEIYDADPDNTAATLVNMSNRGYVGTGGEVMITGFVVSSEGAKTLLIRAVGPALAAAPYNVPNTLSDPVMQVFRREANGTDTLVLSHDNWSDDPDADEVAAIAASVSAFPLPNGSKDAAVVATMDPGVYTVVVSGVAGATGAALVEVYAVE